MKKNQKVVTESNDTVTTTSIAQELLFENDTIAIYKIDSVSFHQLRAENDMKRDTLVYISDLEEARKVLRGRVVFAGYNEDTGLIDSNLNDGMIYKLRFANGKEFSTNTSGTFFDVGFSRYYPSEDILLCEGGHSSDYSFDLKRGIMGPELVGNPEYLVSSASGKFRLNGWFPGQECSTYFIQQKVADQYQWFVGLPIDLSKEAFDLCTIQDIFWKGDGELYFHNMYYGVSDDDRLGFFKLVLK